MDELNMASKGQQDDFDELTGLLNLKGVLKLLNESKSSDENAYSVIIYLNVMNFKSFNQQYGFAGGNEFLKGLSGEIQRIFSNEIIARTGGDHFIILSKSKDEESIKEKLDAITEISRKYERGLKMHIKAGIYLSTGDENDPVIMIDRAKIACDDIIRVYDKYYNFYDDALKKKNELRQYVIDNFESAFKKRYFKVYYQKEVRALTGKVCGYEALARWIDPNYGMISPAIFVEVLEDVHLVHKLDIYIINQVCADIKNDIEYGMAVEPVSVNLSRLDFELCDIKAEIDKCREKYGIPANLLNIEITESAIASGESFLGDQIKKFRDGGYQVWMDDFGSGYSSLNNLKVYDFDVLKIDMDFLRTFETNKKTQVILATIVNMAKELDMHTLAEGVETQEQYEFLRRIGCEKMQGYLFGKPKPLDEFVRPDDFSFDNCEDIAYQDYYHDIGEINFLGSTPLREKNMDVYNNLPIAIMELENDEIRFIYANNAYHEFLRSVSIKDIGTAGARSFDMNIPENNAMREVLRKAENSPDRRSDASIIINGNVIIAKVRFIARQGDKAAFAVVPRNLSLTGSEQRLADSIHVAMAHVFNQYFRVDLYDEDGTVENIFLNTDQLAVADVESNAVRAVQMYSNMYLYPEDRERFRKFYDMTTVQERVKNSSSDYVVDYYHSAIPGDRGRMQMYMILPFYYNDRWKYISCCRYADEVTDEQIYGDYKGHENPNK
ncbi:bifunctional diguanylate cyclase/phosphodiesterase [Butyrivibrio sp. VCB2006]|uniref:bifunctional diguanylate cyclase/phosphodiesterase n=1 Tax=Butyrivibrio sp. VCB2006 TaxID=1280679 RepID=UPI000404EB08|nr:bifunctional diguanylate cyclase/phosphodiesterase [Butyrivibrio sp. VCB2006]